MEFEKLAKEMGLKEEEYLELVELFIETGMSDLDELLRANESGDLERAADAAHSLKGAADNFGQRDIYELAREIEGRIREGRMEGISQSVQTLRSKIEAIAEMVRR